MSIVEAGAAVNRHESAGNFGIGVVVDEPVGIDEDEEPRGMPRLCFGQNFPNPFNFPTTITFEVSGGVSRGGCRHPEKKPVPDHMSSNGLSG